MSEDERSPRSDKRPPTRRLRAPEGFRRLVGCYFDENGRRHREKVGPKALATKVYQKRKNEVQERRFFPERIRRRDVLLADFFKDYLARVKGRLRCYREYDRYAKHLAATFPGRTLRQLLPGDIERYVAKRSQEVLPATVNRNLQFLKHVFYVAMKDGLCERNPVREVRLFKENNQRVRFLTEEGAMTPAGGSIAHGCRRTCAEARR